MRSIVLMLLALSLPASVFGAETSAPLPSHPLDRAVVETFLQTVVTNPRAVEFACPDHDKDDQHELDIRALDGTVVQTILLGDPAADATTGVVHADINVQPVAFGQYRVVVRAVAGTFKSVNSGETDVWERSPGAPSNVVVK